MLIKNDNITSLIFNVRGERVMLDFHLAMLYDVETRVLKQAVRRNIERFPYDFMFDPTPPFAFTEQGVAMLSSVLKSERAIQVNMLIMRVFVKTRQLLKENEVLKERVDVLEEKYEAQFQLIFEAINKLMTGEAGDERRPIGFKTQD